MQDDWAFQEFARVPLWDSRCRTTLILAAQQLAEQSQLSLSHALGSRRKAVSRILHHAGTSAHLLLSGHIGATARRCASGSQASGSQASGSQASGSQAEPLPSLVLVASDTSVCDFTRHKAVDGLGPISDSDYQRGFFVHSALAMTPHGVPLGLLYQHSWVRPEQEEADENIANEHLTKSQAKSR